MPASSTTGRGLGSAEKHTTKELAILSNGPAIHLTGVFEISANNAPPSSPPSSVATIVFPEPLVGSANDYVVLLTTQNAGTAYVTFMNESNGKFLGFSAVANYDGTVMYLVASIGIRPSI